MIGLGTGAWAKLLAASPEVEKITIVEINDACIELIGKIPEVKSILHNPKIDIVIDDGRRWLNANPNKKFDYFCLNSTIHSINFAGNLLSKNFYNLLKKHMTPQSIVLINPTRGAHTYKTFADSFKYIFIVPEIYGVIIGSQKPFVAESISKVKGKIKEFNFLEGRSVSMKHKEYRKFVERVTNAMQSPDNFQKSTVLIEGAEIITDDYLPNEYYLIKYILNGKKYTNFLPKDNRK
jgi:spermidine synthase